MRPAGIQTAGPALLLAAAGLAQASSWPNINYDDHTVCEGEACVERHTHLYPETRRQVAGRNMTVSSWDDLAVDTISLLADCAPGLTLSAISTERSSCDEVSWRYWDGCNYRAAGWLERDGETLSPGLAARLAPAGAADQVAACLAWDGEADYDYYDYYEYYDYYYLEDGENSDDDSAFARSKREVGATSKRAGQRQAGRRGKRNLGQKKNSRKDRAEEMKEERREKRKMQRNHGRSRRKLEKTRKIKKSTKFSKKVGKQDEMRKKNHKKEKKENFKILKKAEKAKKKAEKKKRKKKEARLLRSVGLDSLPSDATLNKLYCVERAVWVALEQCGENILAQANIV